MKRDMDLARQILFALEERDSVEGWVQIEIEGIAPEVISYHVWLLHDAGLIEAMDASTMDGHEWFPVSLNWDGHEFLDSARDDTRWSKTKKLVIDKTGGLSFEALKFALIEGIKAALS